MADTLENEVIKEICSSGDKTATIPATTASGSNALSYAEGFPIATSTPQSDNGIPPRRTDMNKVLNLLSKNLVFLQNGGAFTFDSDIATAIGGYPKGARLLYQADSAKIYIESAVDNNETAPTKANIFYSNRIRVAEGLINVNDTPPVSASASTLGQIYLVKASGAYTPYKVSKAYVCVYSNGEYSWSLVNANAIFKVSTLYNTKDIVYVKSTQEYLTYYNSTDLTVIGYSDLNAYKWIYVNDIPTEAHITIVDMNRDNNGNWYKIYSNGWIEQGGITEGGSSGNKTITFQFEMADTKYFIGLSTGIGSGSGSTNNRIEESDILTTGFTLWSGSPSKYTWEVKGLKK